MSGIQLTYDKNLTEDIKVTLPTSKSMAARALIIAAIAGKRPASIGDLPVCTDTAELSAAVNALLDLVPDPTARVDMREPSPLCLNLNLGLGGTSLRFFTALAASVPACEFEIDCAAPLKKRPLAPLCEALNTAGASIGYLDNAGYPPLLIRGHHIEGGSREISAAISSQFVSSMIMCAPIWKSGLQLHLSGEHAVSVPYIDMTIRMMRKAGAEVSFDRKNNIITVAARPYTLIDASDLKPEADWSAASYFYELALLLPDRKIEISSLTPPACSLQGDSACAEIFSRLGVATTFNENGSATLCCDKTKLEEIVSETKESPVVLDMSDTPDLVPALAVALCLSGIRFKIVGIGHLRHKESDRISAIEIELSKIGYALDTGDDFMSWTGRRTPTGENETIETYHDHRIAMAFAPAATRLPYLSILNPKVTEKSFPDYFSLLKTAGFSIRPF